MTPEREAGGRGRAADVGASFAEMLAAVGNAAASTPTATSSGQPPKIFTAAAGATSHVAAAGGTVASGPAAADGTAAPDDRPFRRANFADAFKESDTDGDGVLSKDEFVQFEKKTNPTGMHLTEAFTGKVVDGAYMFSAMDRFKAGHLSREQAASFAQTSGDGTFAVRGVY